jgi:demethylmenaquinone methyltransferase/2-methoxy-6-polyprenyl-1,4-benzoquinol methylase
MEQGSGLDDALSTQRRYYDLYAPDYLCGTPAREVGPAVLELPDATAVVDELRPVGAVLELACGSGVFTERLARTAETLTAVDASGAMLARNRAEVGRPNVRYVQADLFAWRPDRTYDLVFFGFWLSHVPPARFDAFWALVRSCVVDGGRVAFVDEDDLGAHRDDVRMVDGVPLAPRPLPDGRSFDIVKLYWHPDELAARLAGLDWDFDVRRLGNGFMRGIGTPTGGGT